MRMRFRDETGSYWPALRLLARLWPFAFISLSLGCTLSISAPAAPSPTPPTAPVDPTGWTLLAPGLERRTYAPKPNNALVQLTVVRFDPAYFAFRAHYRPGAGLGLTGWRDTLAGASAFINGNFFDPQGFALGLVVSDGVASGQTLSDRGGMFQVADGQPRVRSLIAEPYVGEALEQAVQAFPMLVVNGQASYNNQADTDVARRSVVAQDSSGRILLMATSLLGLTLSDLSAFLAASDMAIATALNLDGGGSTLLYVGAGAAPIAMSSFDAVPVVLAVYPR